VNVRLGEIHGTSTCYRAGCRCDQCRRANAVACYHLKRAREALSLPPGDPRHGENGYANYSCRCPVCKEGRRLVIRERAARLAPDDPRHGSASTYANHGCRCDACTEACRVYRARLRTKGS
jgi:hypothetical protein